MPEFPVQRSDEEWRAVLDENQFAVLRQAATEPPFTGALLHVDEDGGFRCAGCQTLLFASDAKFDSGSGWPSFDTAVGPVLERKDRSHFMVRTEVVCGSCGGHLGHLFDDGPTSTGLRYCINSAAIDFMPSADDAPSS